MTPVAPWRPTGPETVRFRMLGVALIAMERKLKLRFVLMVSLNLVITVQMFSSKFSVTIEFRTDYIWW